MDFDVEYDVVVVGGGGSGKMAAYAVASNSSLSVAILEKMPKTGGSSAFAEGTCASESPIQNSREVPDYFLDEPVPEGGHYPTHEEHFKSYIEYSHHRANPDVVRAFVFNSGDTIQALQDIGVEWTKASVYSYGQDDELYTFHRPDGLGARVQELLLRACVNAGVEIFCSTPAKELIMDEGKVVGVIATDADGNEMRIGARAVVLASGGFADDRELVSQLTWIPGLTEKVLPPRVGIENTGDGLRMAKQAGGATRNLGTLMCSSRLLDKAKENPLSYAVFQPTLYINMHGKRFYDESVVHYFADMGNTIAQLDEGRIYIIHSMATLKRLEEKGSDISLGDVVPYGIKIPAQAVIDEAQNSMDTNDGTGFMADTIEGLAEAIGLDVDTFVANVNRYNELCHKGYDEDFFKDAQYMVPIEEGPFIAIRKVPSINVSCGGIRVNGNFQVTDEVYNPIPGLYAVGNEASGLYGDTYNLQCPGSANGFAHTSGRMAGLHIVETLA